MAIVSAMVVGMMKIRKLMVKDCFWAFRQGKMGLAVGSARGWVSQTVFWSEETKEIRKMDDRENKAGFWAVVLGEMGALWSR